MGQLDDGCDQEMGVVRVSTSCLWIKQREEESSGGARAGREGTNRRPLLPPSSHTTTPFCWSQCYSFYQSLPFRPCPTLAPFPPSFSTLSSSSTLSSPSPLPLFSASSRLMTREAPNRHQRRAGRHRTDVFAFEGRPILFFSRRMPFRAF
jgi:hypothetical protein